MGSGPVWSGLIWSGLLWSSHHNSLHSKFQFCMPIMLYFELSRAHLKRSAAEAAAHQYFETKIRRALGPGRVRSCLVVVVLNDNLMIFRRPQKPRPDESAYFRLTLALPASGPIGVKKSESQRLGQPKPLDFCPMLEPGGPMHACVHKCVHRKCLPSPYPRLTCIRADRCQKIRI